MQKNINVCSEIYMILTWQKIQEIEKIIPDCELMQILFFYS